MSLDEQDVNDMVQKSRPSAQEPFARGAIAVSIGTFFELFDGACFQWFHDESD